MEPCSELVDAPLYVPALEGHGDNEPCAADKESRGRRPSRANCPDRQDRADENRVQDRDDGRCPREHLSQPEPSAAAGLHTHGHSDTRKVVVSAHHEVPLEVGRELKVGSPNAVHSDHAQRFVVVRRAEADPGRQSDEQDDREDHQGKERERLAESGRPANKA